MAEGPRRAAVAAAIGDACLSHGFFQALKHGIDAFCCMSTSFNVRKETVHNWHDYLRLHCPPTTSSCPTGRPIRRTSSTSLRILIITLVL
ncbi:hypothetical protein BAE44_0025711 [Dichanthelium oligosanthes]|uniref:Uncharacterized protein n=1 Tax=Dichanthelium oligosanthes TaxID=888268 RepID=A0A1E5UK68_9POAL|nr:hypothetical protein BAE44_0025711 [Dichanthelium oligosanthes]